MIVNLLIEHHFAFLSLNGGCTSSSASTLVKMPHCWKSHVTAHISLILNSCVFFPWLMYLLYIQVPQFASPTSQLKLLIDEVTWLLTMLRMQY